ncbi:MAG: c-type cytochrome [Pirellulales bacterium]|nr:c-type cytochrome [Pirellulales bacterium]
MPCGSGCRRSQPAANPAKPAGAQGESASSSDQGAAATDSAKGTASEPGVAAPAEEQPAAEKVAATGSQLFSRHCGSCHGERGDGKGIAAAYLFPKPRDFRTGRFRLTSTTNSVPTREDLHAVLLRGMPGSSMPSWAHLSQAERDLLVDEVQRIRSEGIRESYLAQLKEEEELTDEEIAADEVQQAIEEHVKTATTPGENSAVPEMAAASPESIERGKGWYAKFVCISCHGETGKGDGAERMFDDDKTPTRPRDFTLGIFKGNPDPASLYRRISLGMPGTPMPGSSNMTPEQMVDLVHYIRSLSTEEQRQAAVLKREKIVAQRVGAVPGIDQAEAWSQAKAVQVRTTPLWWRPGAAAEVTVQAVHDGQTLAVRLSWADATGDEHALRSESFEDAVAMELYQGEAEPFLGMGSMASPVDVWFWDADRQHGEIAAEKINPNAVADVYPFSEKGVAGTELSRPGARMADQPDISLPARATGNQIVPRSEGSGGSSLQVGGPRTVTFRIPKSQLVVAQGEWKDGRWTVVMTRPLAVPSAEEGLSLEPGGRASVALAVWDGAHADRDGQKSITIWQDLELER